MEPGEYDPKEYQPVAELPEEQQNQFTELERRTDTVFNLRNQLARFTRANRKYFPKVTVLTGPIQIDASGSNVVDIAKVPHITKTTRLEDMHQTLLEREKDDSIDQFIDWYTVDQEIDQLPKSDRDKELLKKWKRTQLKLAFSDALTAYAQLKSLHGVWDGTDLQAEEQVTKDYYRMRFGERHKAVEQIDTLIAQTEEIEALRDLARSDSDFVMQPAEIQALNANYQQVAERLKKLTEENPEAYQIILERQLKGAKETFDSHGTIVEVPYVKAKITRIEDILDQNRPVFIHGELGAGKTELAKHIGRTRLSKKHLERFDKKNPSPLKEWETDNPAPQDPSEKKRWELQRKAELATELGEKQREWEARRAIEAETLIVSGHKHVEQEQILASRAIHRTEAPSVEKQMEIINKNWERYREKVLRGARGDVSVDELKAQLDNNKEMFEKAYLETFRSPIETTAILAPVLRAMKEGRPCLVDEINAIPHHTNILLNDILTYKPGDLYTPPFPEIKPFIVQEGWSLIATGNYRPEDGVMYVGRQPIDAAFLSRFGVVSYDYLPMDPTFEEPDLTPEQQREKRSQNELYHMLIARFLNSDLSITLPEGSLKQIRRLATVARNLQNVFSGQNVTSAYYARVNGTEVKPQDVLKENVLSIRHLIPILDRWKKDGFKHPIDDYLFLDYISRSDARPNEKLYLYRVLQIQGDFFPAAQGWPASDQQDKILTYPIDEKMYGVDSRTGLGKIATHQSAPIHIYSVKDVIEELYGPVPKRAYIAREFLEPKPKTLSNATEETEEGLERDRMTQEAIVYLQLLFTNGFNIVSGIQHTAVDSAVKDRIISSVSTGKN